jgi:hypothetical protein
VKGDRLYLFVEHLPKDGKLRLPGIENHIREARWLDAQMGGNLALEDGAIVVSGLNGKEILPVIAVRFDGDLKVQPAVSEPD